MAASHAVCYGMVLTNTIGKQGGTARRVRVTATVTADKSDAGIKIVSSHLKATVEGLEGIDKAKLDELATGAEKRLPHLERDPRHRRDHRRGTGRLGVCAAEKQMRQS